MLPTQFHFYCRFPCWFLLVCLLVAYAMRQRCTISQSAHDIELLLCFAFFRCGSHDKSTLGWRRQRGGDSGFVCVLHYGAYAGLQWRGWGPHWRGTQPELRESRGAQENTGAPKQNTFYGNGYIYLHGSQKNHCRMAF